MWIDVGKLIREHVPDKNGNTLPADLASGSYEFRDLTNKGVGTLFEGKVIYDKTYGHVAYGCGICCGYSSANVWYNPLGVPFGFAADQGVNAFDTCAVSTSDVSASFYGNWYSLNTSIVNVDAYSGAHTGVSVGSTTSLTSGRLDDSTRINCPLRTFTPGGGVDVQKPGFLQVVSSTTTTACQGASCEADLKYKVLDVNQAPMNIAGMTIRESVSSDNGTCHSPINDSGQWSTDSSGTMIGVDAIDTCPGSSTCQVSFTQSFTVNGFAVLILSQAGTISGTHNAITINCTSSGCSCPSIIITP